MLTPWVKFLWEAYRNTLELLRNNARVEKLYHDTAKQGEYIERPEYYPQCKHIHIYLFSLLKENC